MQDTQSGALVPVSSLSQQDRDAKLPRHQQGATFYQGEEVRLKGGFFAVHSIGREMITLRGLPGTPKPRMELKTAHHSALAVIEGILACIEKLPAPAQRALGITPESRIEDIVGHALEFFAAAAVNPPPAEEPATPEPSGPSIVTGQAH